VKFPEMKERKQCNSIMTNHWEKTRSNSHHNDFECDINEDAQIFALPLHLLKLNNDFSPKSIGAMEWKYRLKRILFKPLSSDFMYTEKMRGANGYNYVLRAVDFLNRQSGIVFLDRRCQMSPFGKCLSISPNANTFSSMMPAICSVKGEFKEVASGLYSVQIRMRPMMQKIDFKLSVSINDEPWKDMFHCDGSNKTSYNANVLQKLLCKGSGHEGSKIQHGQHRYRQPRYFFSTCVVGQINLTKSSKVRFRLTFDFGKNTRNAVVAKIDYLELKPHPISVEVKKATFESLYPVVPDELSALILDYLEPKPYSI